MWNFLCTLNLCATSRRVHCLTLKYAVLTTNTWVNSSSYESVTFHRAPLTISHASLSAFCPHFPGRRLVRWNDSAHSAATGGRWGVTVSGWQKVAALSLGVWLSCMVLMTGWQKGHTHRKTQKTTFHPQKVYHHMAAWVLFFWFLLKMFYVFKDRSNTMRD